MERLELGPDGEKTAQEILGYLNFSSGAADPRFLANINRLFAEIGGSAAADAPAAPLLLAALRQTLAELTGRSDAFRQVDQAEAVLSLAFDRLPREYRRWHSDLLFHQTDAALLTPFFLARGAKPYSSRADRGIRASGSSPMRSSN